MAEASRIRATTLVLCGLTACAAAEDAERGEPAAWRAEEPGVIDVGTPPLDASLDASVGANVDASTDDRGDGGRARPGTSVVVKDPHGAYFADVTAYGTGCPAGTWSTWIRPEGQSFTMSLAAFEAEVDRTRAISIKDCNLSFKIHSLVSLSYTVEEFSFAGYAYMEPGISLRVQSSYTFQGTPYDGIEQIRDMQGPMDAHFFLADEHTNSNLVKSRCGPEQTLDVKMSIRLRNSSPRGNGYANIPLSPMREPTLKLSWKRCDP